MARAQTRVTINDTTGGKLPEKAEAAVEDFDEAIRIMEEDSGSRGTDDYADVFVRRALAKEEIAFGRRDARQWEGAAADYSRAIDVWRSKTEGNNVDDVNPMVLNFRGNALSQLGRFDDAVADYREAAGIFFRGRQLREASLSTANEALALFGAGRRAEATDRMEYVIRRDPGVTDAHVALAATYWAAGKVNKAEERWRFACENISSGCSSYKDISWVSDIRRWPAVLVKDLQAFFKRTAPA